MNRYVPTLALIRSRRGRDGYLCHQCYRRIDHMPRLWLHKIARRHPFRPKSDGIHVVRVTSATTWTFDWSSP